MPRGVDQGPAEGAVAEKGPSSAPVGLRETVAAPLTAAHVISWLYRCSFASRPRHRYARRATDEGLGQWACLL